jgi:hypothetical protein
MIGSTIIFTMCEEPGNGVQTLCYCDPSFFSKNIRSLIEKKIVSNVFKKDVMGISTD